MRVCLIPLRIKTRDVAANFTELKSRLHEAARHKPDLICLPESPLTGYLYEQADLTNFAEPIPGKTSDKLGQLAHEYSTYLCAGLLERASEGVYNTAVLFNRSGKIILSHRKIEEKPPFLNGSIFQSIDTEFGRLGILICGDLFSEQVISKIDGSLVLLLMPMSRCFAGKSPDMKRWQTEERKAYLEAVKAAGVTTLIVNALEIAPEDGSFGGAMVIGADGNLLAESLHGTDNLLILDIER